jgi:hypothetical protein
MVRLWVELTARVCVCRYRQYAAFGGGYNQPPPAYSERTALAMQMAVGGVIIAFSCFIETSQARA